MPELGNATRTTLALGSVSTPIALYRTVGEPKDAKYDTAGPNGGELHYEEKAEESPPEEAEATDPLATDPEAYIGLPIKTDERLPQDTAVVTGLATPGRYRRVLVEEGTGVEVEKADVRRGVRQPDGCFVDLTDGLREIDDKTKLEQMRVVSFIRVEQVPRDRITGAYWVAPGAPGGAKVLALLRKAMRTTRRVAVVKWTKRSRQALGVMVAHHSGALQVLEVAFAALVRKPDDKVLSPSHVPVTDTELAAAVALVKAMSDSVMSLDELEDDAVVLRRELLEKAAAGEAFTVSEHAPEVSESVLDAFRASTQS